MAYETTCPGCDGKGERKTKFGVLVCSVCDGAGKVTAAAAPPLHWAKPKAVR